MTRDTVRKRETHLPVALGVDEDDVVAAVVVARVHEHGVQRVVGRRLRLLLQVRVQVDVLVELEPGERVVILQLLICTRCVSTADEKYAMES